MDSKFVWEKRVDYGDAGPDFYVPPFRVVSYMLEAAVHHSVAVGLGPRVMLGSGVVWVLHRFSLEVNQYPTMADELSIATWHHGTRGIRALRDYEVQRNGETIARGSSAWLLWDKNSGRILRIPEQYKEAYGLCLERALETDLADWKPTDDFEVGFTLPLTARPADFDALGHVNSRQYISYAMAGLSRHHAPGYFVKSLTLQFDMQIADPHAQLEVDVSANGARSLFAIRTGETTHARGEARILPSRP